MGSRQATSGSVSLAAPAAPPAQQALAAALGDSGLRLAYRCEPDGAWVDLAGTRVDAAAAGRVATVVERDGAPLALIEHDPSVDAARLAAACNGLADALSAEATIAALRARTRSLQLTEQRLLDVFETVDLMVAAMDLDGILTYMNPFGERLSGWSREELVGRNWFATFRSGRESFLERIRGGEFPPRDSSTIVVRNDERHQMEWYNVPLRDESGAVVGVLGIGRDATDELRALRSLEQAERRMLDVFETVQLIVVQIDLDARVSYANEFLVRLSGWTRDELLGRDWFATFRTGSDAEFERVRAGQVAQNNKTPLRLRSGETRMVDWYNVPLRDESGRLTGVVGIGRDITDQLLAEREARELLAEHAALERVAVEVARGASDDAVFALVAEQAGELVGADGCNLLRFEPDETAEILAAWDAVPGDRPQQRGLRVPIPAGPAMHAVFRSGTPERAMAAEGWLDPAGRELPLHAAVAAPITVDGELWGALAALYTTDQPPDPDTERRLGAFTSLVAIAIANADARSALRASRMRLVSAGDEARRRLERNLHDGAQQRFVSVSLALRLVLAQLGRDPAGAATHLERAVDELASGLAELRELARGIHPAILTDRGLAAAVAQLADRAPLPVEARVADDRRLPAEIEAAAYYVVAESLTNVARYAEASLATVTVEVGGETLRVEVTDDGIGGADAATGSGLRGLTDRVEAFGGRLEVDSPPGGGTRVSARLPLASA